MTQRNWRWVDTFLPCHYIRFFETKVPPQRPVTAAAMLYLTRNRRSEMARRFSAIVAGPGGLADGTGFEHTLGSTSNTTRLAGGYRRFG